MDPLEYCRVKATPEGSSLYYGLLFLPPPGRHALLALATLELELVEVVEGCSDPVVAKGKLAYWAEELAAALAGSPGHPVTRALHATGAATALGQAGMERLTEGTAARLTTAQIRDRAQLERHCRETAGVVAGASAELLAPGDAGERAALEALATGLELLRLLRLPQRAGMPPHSAVPLTELSRFGVKPSLLDAGGAHPDLAALRAHLLARARATIAGACDDFDTDRGFGPTRARLALAESRAVERHGYVREGTLRGVSPLHRLWIAWRHRPR